MDRLQTVSLVAGIILLIIGLGSALWPQADLQPQPVKEQVVPINQEDILADPLLRKAIERQLNGAPVTDPSQEIQQPTGEALQPQNATPQDQ